MRKIKIRNKKANVLMDNLLWIILLVLVLLVVLFFLYKNTLTDWIINLPGYKYDFGEDEIDMSDLPEDYLIQLNYFKVAVVSDGSKIKFCTNGDCNKLRNSNLYWTGGEKIGEIYVAQNGMFNIDALDADNKIALVKDRLIMIDRNIMAGRGRLYVEVQKDLPLKYDLLNLNNAIYISGTIYRDKEITHEEISKSREIPKIEKWTDDMLEPNKKFILSYSLMTDTDDFLRTAEYEYDLKNKWGDSNLELKNLGYVEGVIKLIMNEDIGKARFFLKGEGGRISDSVIISESIDEREKVFDDIFEKLKKEKVVIPSVKPGPQDISKYINAWKFMKNGDKSDWILLNPEIENSNSETGFDSGGWDNDDLEYVQYAKENDRFWVRFMDDDRFGNDITQWISMDYWNKYRSFADVPYEENGNLIRGLND